MLPPVSNDDEDFPTGPGADAPAPHGGAWKARIGAAIAVVILAATSVGYAVRHDSTPPPVVFEPGPAGERPAPLNADDASGGDSTKSSTNAASPAKAGPTPASAIVVHVSGRVRRPGVYRLAAGSRVLDAVNAAGGAEGDGDIDKLNLAAFAEDGTRITVPAREAQAPTPLAPPPAVPPQPAPVTPGGPPAAPGGLATGPDRNDAVAGRAFRDAISPRLADAGSTKRPLHPVDINHAGIEELQTLPAIGPEMARRIVEYRRINGPFQSIEQLNRVDGIGAGKLDKLRPYVVIG